MSTAQTGRTHGCSDQCCNVKIFLANPEPSTHGPSRHFAASQQLGRFWREADIKYLARPAGSVPNDPTASSFASVVTSFCWPLSGSRFGLSVPAHGGGG